jgi:hypothetical protein
MEGQRATSSARGAQGRALLLRAALLALLAAACAQPAPPARGVTVVSGYWKISSKHSNEDYAVWFSNTLRVDAPYVFYYGAGPNTVGAQADAAAEGVRSAVAASRGSRRTRFVRRDMSAFRSFGTYDAGWTHRQHVPTTALALVWLEKVALLADACTSAYSTWTRTRWLFATRRRRSRA